MAVQLEMLYVCYGLYKCAGNVFDDVDHCFMQKETSYPPHLAALSYYVASKSHLTFG